MSEFEGFTPGPWVAEASNVQFPERGDAEVSCWSDADARLIAAAPSLLAERDRYKEALVEIADHAAVCAEQYAKNENSDRGYGMWFQVDAHTARAALNPPTEEEPALD